MLNTAVNKTYLLLLQRFSMDYHLNLILKSSESDLSKE